MKITTTGTLFTLLFIGLCLISVGAFVGGGPVVGLVISGAALLMFTAILAIAMS